MVLLVLDTGRWVVELEVEECILPSMIRCLLDKVRGQEVMIRSTRLGAGMIPWDPVWEGIREVQGWVDGRLIHLEGLEMEISSERRDSWCMICVVG